MGEFGRNTGIQEAVLAGDGIPDFLRIKIMRADCVGPLRDKCGSSPGELTDE